MTDMGSVEFGFFLLIRPQSGAARCPPSTPCPAYRLRYAAGDSDVIQRPEPSRTMVSARHVFQSLKSAVTDFMNDGGTTMAAGISYYTVFSLPPLLVLMLMIASVFVDPRTVQDMIQGQFAGMIGQDSASAIATMIQSAKRPGSGGPIATVLGILALLLGAVGALSALQQALNRAWEVAPDPSVGGIKNFITKRIFSFGLILGVAFLLMVSLVVSAALQAFGAMLGGYLPGGADTVFAEVLNSLISLAVFAALFAAMYKVIPDAIISWRDVRVGAIATALFFTVGKLVIGLYLGRSAPGSAFGAAGSLVVILVWIYYSACIVIFGAEFTQAWATAFGKGIEPAPGAVRMVERPEPSARQAAKAKGKRR
jgi:membrane protein